MLILTGAERSKVQGSGSLSWHHSKIQNAGITQKYKTLTHQGKYTFLLVLVRYSRFAEPAIGTFRSQLQLETLCADSKRSVDLTSARVPLTLVIMPQ